MDQNVDMQQRELRDYCARRGWEIAGEYSDIGVSGSKDRRPGLDAMMKACRRRQVDGVIVFRFDRFSRSLKQLIGALEEFNVLNIQFVSLHEAVDTSTPGGQLVFAIFGAIAQFERLLIRERVKSGIAAARARGARIGRPRAMVDPGRITALRAAGRSWRQIARELGIGAATARERFTANPPAVAVNSEGGGDA